MKQTKSFYITVINALMLIGILFSSSCTSGTDDPTPLVNVNAGSDQLITLGETINLDGTVTGENLVLLWEITSRPAGSTVFIANPQVEDISFTPDVSGDYTMRLTATGDGGAQTSDDVIITVEEGETPEEIGGTISANTTLVNRFADPTIPDYIASSRVLVNAELTIEPDVYIIFKEDQGMSISTSGAIIAVGTATESILFSGVEKTKAFWKGIELESNNSKNEMTYCVVEYGGSSGFDGANLKTNLMVQGSGRVKITNSRFTNSDGYGLYTRSLEANLPEFANNTFTANEAPIMTRINHYHYFDSNSDYSGNSDNYIDSYWSNKVTTEDVEWQALNVSYRMSNNVENIASDIIIAPGTSFLGQPNGGFTITPSGSLNAVGTTTEKINFIGEQDVRGYWKGIAFESNNTSNELTFVLISNGGEEGFDGANLKTNLMVQGSGRVKITNTTSTKSSGYGLYTRALESSLPEFSNNTFTDNVAPVMTRINHYHYFDSNSDYSSNDDDYIDSYWSNKDVTVKGTWIALNVPYRMANNVEDIDAAITIQEGASFIGQPNGGFQITDNGSLKAIGAVSSPITFKGEQDVIGYWKGLRFMSNNANNVLNNIMISNGGEEGFDGANRKANIEISNGGLLSLSNSTINKSGNNGVRVQKGGSLSQSNLTFSGNLGLDIVKD